MTDLRTGAIEAAAKGARESKEWYRETQADWLIDTTILASATLDAVLDYLEAHADEWFDAWISRAGNLDKATRRFTDLIRVLRSEDTG